MRFKINKQFKINVGFEVTCNHVIDAVNETNLFLSTLPSVFYKSVDFKTTGAAIGAIFCDKLSKFIPEASINPIEKGHPDIIPTKGLNATEEKLRNYPEGVEIKGTIGNIKQGCNLRAGQKRITELTGITWQAHHREVNHLMAFIWDFANENNGFLYPAIVGVFYSDRLNPNDWGEISGTTGRNTKVTGMIKSGKEKMGIGWIVLLDLPDYVKKITSFLYLQNI